MAEIQLGKGYIYSISGNITQRAATAYSAGVDTPNIQGVGIEHHSEGKVAIKSTSGVTVGIVFSGEDCVTVNFEFIPEGSTKANAKVSAALPIRGQTFQTASFPVIAVGNFSDVLNATSTNPWIYEGGGGHTLSIDGVATMKIPLTRYIGVTSGTAIT